MSKDAKLFVNRDLAKNGIFVGLILTVVSTISYGLLDGIVFWFEI